MWVQYHCNVNAYRVTDQHSGSALCMTPFVAKLDWDAARQADGADDAEPYRA